MGLNPKFMHLNSHKAMAVANQLSHDIDVAAVDLASFNEPYVIKGSALCVPGVSSVPPK